MRSSLHLRPFRVSLQGVRPCHIFLFLLTLFMASWHRLCDTITLACILHAWKTMTMWMIPTLVVSFVPSLPPSSLPSFLLFFVNEMNWFDQVVITNTVE